MKSTAHWKTLHNLDPERAEKFYGDAKDRLYRDVVYDWASTTYKREMEKLGEEKFRNRYGFRPEPYFILIKENQQREFFNVCELSPWEKEMIKVLLGSKSEKEQAIRKMEEDSKETMDEIDAVSSSGKRGLKRSLEVKKSS